MGCHGLTCCVGMDSSQLKTKWLMSSSLLGSIVCSIYTFLKKIIKRTILYNLIKIIYFSYIFWFCQISCLVNLYYLYIIIVTFSLWNLYANLTVVLLLKLMEL